VVSGGRSAGSTRINKLAIVSFRLDRRGVFQCEAWLQWPWLDHGFSTRHSADWLQGRDLASLRQIHSNVVVPAESAGVLGEGDALVTDRADLAIAIRTADCVPVLLVDPVHRAVAAIHSGWRGTVSGIAARAVEMMTAKFGSVTSDVHAAIGPSIGACCYEVGPEVAEKFGKQGRVRIDLPGELSGQLELAGLLPSHIYRGEFCTECQTNQFWSYRREGEAAGRMWSGAAIR
jgi:YfiH family protein